MHKMAQMPADKDSNKGVRKVINAWVHAEGPKSNRPVGRPYQTVRAGYKKTLKQLGYEGEDSNLLERWISDAEDLQTWGTKVEEALSLPDGSFQSSLRNT